MSLTTSWRFLVTWLAVMGFLSGCVSDDVLPSTGPAAATLTGHGRPSIVALLDTGLDVYHEAFRSHKGGPSAEDYTAVGATVVELTSEGSYEERLAADIPVWQSVKPYTLYAFAGTRVLVISLLETASPSATTNRPIVLDPTGHGTGTASVVADYDPRALIVMVQVDPTGCVNRARADCAVHPSVARGMEWIAAQSWIDIVSISLAAPGNAPDDPRLHREMGDYIAASREAHRSGKLILNGAGNSIAPPLPNYFNGPPWIVAVGGVEVNPKGAPWMASQQVDLVANYSVWMATRGTLDEREWGFGTSFATPTVAATLSMTLRQVRESVDGSLDEHDDGALAIGRLGGRPVQFESKDFRDALNASAAFFSPTDWRPTQRPSNETYPGAEIDEATIPILVPYAQMGWGYIEPGMAGEIARRVLSGDTSAPREKSDAGAHQATWQRVRETYWSDNR